jgi:FtsH-binding integral membrane protein
LVIVFSTPTVQRHLFKVYTTLAATLACAALGSVAHLYYNIGGLLTVFGGIGLILALCLTPFKEKNVPLRTLYLFGVGFLEGASIGPLLQAVLEIDPAIPAMALLGTVAIFGCFSASARYAERRSYLFLSGLLGSGLSTLLLLGLVNIFFRLEILYTFQLYLGLIVFCGFVMYDTQLVIEKASMGDKDYIWHSLDLFLDFVNIFVRLVVILTKNKKK